MLPSTTKYDDDGTIHADPATTDEALPERLAGSVVLCCAPSPATLALDDRCKRAVPLDERHPAAGPGSLTRSCGTFRIGRSRDASAGRRVWPKGGRPGTFS